MDQIRCAWGMSNPAMMQYHDEEWGVPVHDDQELFERLVLELNQAGLSWQTILNKRDNFRAAYDNFEIEQVAQYDTAKYNALLADAGIIRNRLKVNAAIVNAQQVLKLQAEFGSFDRYVWSFTDGQVVQNQAATMAEVPGQSALSDEMSKDLKHKGFKFMGTKIVYSFLQSVGVINDHVVDCYRYPELGGKRLK